MFALLLFYCTFLIDQSHKYHNAFDKYPMMHHFVTEMCTCVYISVTKWCSVGYRTGALWDLCNMSIHWCDIFTRILQRFWHSCAIEVILKDVGRIDQPHKSHHAPVPDPTMQHSERKCAHCGIWGRRFMGFFNLANWSVSNHNKPQRKQRNEKRVHNSWDILKMTFCYKCIKQTSKLCKWFKHV